MSTSTTEPFGNGHAVAATRPLAAEAPSFRWISPAAWASAGFVVGATVWHFVGFWSFVTVAVLGGPEWGVPAVQSNAAIVPPAGACATLVLDRATGLTRLDSGCDGAMAELAHHGRGGRDDRGDMASLAAE